MDIGKKKLTGDPKIDFSEMFDNEIDNFDELEIDINLQISQIEKENQYLKKIMIDEIIENVEIKKDNSIYDKRLKKSLFRKIYDTLFGI